MENNEDLSDGQGYFWVRSQVTGARTQAGPTHHRFQSPGSQEHSTPCFLAVSRTLLRMAKSRAPSLVRKLPEIFCLRFKGRRPLSEILLVAGTRRGS